MCIFLNNFKDFLESHSLSKICKIVLQYALKFIFRQQENLVDDQKCQAGFRPLCNKILLLTGMLIASKSKDFLC